MERIFETSAADVRITGVLDAQMHRITGLDLDVETYPALPEDGVSKAYVDWRKQQIQDSLPDLADNGVF